jgi:S1-C subfamily serine protease
VNRHPRPGSHCGSLLSLLLAGLVGAGGVAGLAARQGSQLVDAQESPARSVVQLWIMKLNVNGYQSRYESEAAGTAFLIGADGRAVTNSHVLGPARASPRSFHIVATAGSEFFSGRIICASALPPMVGDTTVLHRDVAVIQLVPPEIPVQGFSFAGVERWRPHQGPMPHFTPLRFGAPPAAGDLVRVLGFGSRPGTILPYEWSATGTVGLLGQAQDGTAVFTIKFDREAEPGHSGSPVLNRQGEVVGMFTWLRSGERTVGMAISRAALDPACP